MATGDAANGRVRILQSDAVTEGMLLAKVEADLSGSIQEVLYADMQCASSLIQQHWCYSSLQTKSAVSGIVLLSCYEQGMFVMDTCTRMMDRVVFLQNARRWTRAG